MTGAVVGRVVSTFTTRASAWDRLAPHKALSRQPRQTRLSGEAGIADIRFAPQSGRSPAKLADSRNPDIANDGFEPIAVLARQRWVRAREADAANDGADC